MNFHQMIEMVSNGTGCRRESWGAEGHHIGMYPVDNAGEDRLALFKPEVGPGGTWYPWTVSRSDIDAKDWRPVEKKIGLKVAASPVPGKPTVQ